MRIGSFGLLRSRGVRAGVDAPALLTATAFVAAYLILDWISFIHPMPGFNVTPWNPQPAVAIALLMRHGVRWSPAVLVATLAAELFIRGPHEGAAAPIAAAALLALSYAGTAHLLAAVWPVAPKLDQRRDVVRLTAVVTAFTLVTGTAYAGVQAILGSGDAANLAEAAVRFWIGDGVGVLVTLPLILMMADGERRAELKALVLRWETLAQAAAIATALWVVFGQSADAPVKFFYLLFLPLIWIATRSGIVGAVVAAVAVQGGVILAVHVAEQETLTVFELQALQVALAMTGLFLGVTVEERQRATRELRDTLKLAAAGETAAALAHELNQPLTALLGYARSCQILAAEPAGQPRLVQTLQKLVDEAKRAAEVLHRLRDFFRTGATALQRVSLAHVVQQATSDLRVAALARQIELKIDVKGTVPDILLDALQIGVVVQNLVKNAMESVDAAAPASRWVELSVGPDGDRQVRVTITDSGPGLSAEQAFQRFEPLATSKSGGMGMGLAISRAIVEAHGGRLWAIPGPRGALCFTLPCREGPDA